MVCTVTLWCVLRWAAAGVKACHGRSAEAFCLASCKSGSQLRKCVIVSFQGSCEQLYSSHWQAASCCITAASLRCHFTAAQQYQPSSIVSEHTPSELQCASDTLACPQAGQSLCVCPNVGLRFFVKSCSRSCRPMRQAYCKCVLQGLAWALQEPVAAESPRHVPKGTSAGVAETAATVCIVC